MRGLGKGHDEAHPCILKVCMEASLSPAAGTACAAACIVTCGARDLENGVCPGAFLHASNSGGRTPGSKLAASPPPLPRPDGGGQPGRVPDHSHDELTTSR